MVAPVWYFAVMVGKSLELCAAVHSVTKAEIIACIYKGIQRSPDIKLCYRGRKDATPLDYYYYYTHTHTKGNMNVFFSVDSSIIQKGKQKAISGILEDTK